jgi:hypothetical protein
MLFQIRFRPFGETDTWSAEIHCDAFNVDLSSIRTRMKSEDRLNTTCYWGLGRLRVMRERSYKFSAGSLLAVTIAFSWPSVANAQSVGDGSLGGYGASSGFVGAGMGGGGALVIPYGGMTEGFMPSRMGGGSSLSFRARPTATIGSGRTSFSLSPTSGAMSSASRGMSRGLGPRDRMSTPPGLQGGMGLGSGMGRQGSGSLGVMPPSFGYPFRQPPSLLSPSSGGNGMSM